jgi:hypothetical protein
VVLGSIFLWFCTGRRVLLVEVTVKSGMSQLEQALEALVARAECVGVLEFPNRKDVLLVTASPDADKPQNAATVEVARSDWPQWRAV